MKLITRNTKLHTKNTWAKHLHAWKASVEGPVQTLISLLVNLSVNVFMRGIKWKKKFCQIFKHFSNSDFPRNLFVYVEKCRISRAQRADGGKNDDRIMKERLLSTACVKSSSNEAQLLQHRCYHWDTQTALFFFIGCNYFCPNLSFICL